MKFLRAQTSSRLKQQHDKQGTALLCSMQKHLLFPTGHRTQAASHTQSSQESPFITMALSQGTGRSDSQFHLPLPEGIRALWGSSPLCGLLLESVITLGITDFECHVLCQSDRKPDMPGTTAPLWQSHPVADMLGNFQGAALAETAPFGLYCSADVCLRTLLRLEMLLVKMGKGEVENTFHV